MTSEEKMREEFEAYFNYQTEGWAEYSRESSTWVGIDEISATALALLNIRWEAWKASRESLAMQTDQMVSRFLSWPLPDSVCVDGCAKIPGYPLRHGTNLLTADEAKAMLEYVVKGETK